MRRALIIVVAGLTIATWLLTACDGPRDEPTRVLHFKFAPGFVGVQTNAPAECPKPR